VLALRAARCAPGPTQNGAPPDMLLISNQSTLYHRRRHIYFPPFATLRPVTPSPHRASSAPSFSLHRRRNKCDAGSGLSPSQPTLHALRPNTMRNAALDVAFRFAVPTPPASDTTRRLVHVAPARHIKAAYSFNAPRTAYRRMLRGSTTLRAVTPPAKSRPGGVPSLRFGGVRPAASP
jgi:hypothetical protein